MARPRGKTSGEELQEDEVDTADRVMQGRARSCRPGTDTGERLQLLQRLGTVRNPSVGS